MNYEHKYKKYKEKYVSLKNIVDNKMIGGNEESTSSGANRFILFCQPHIARLFYPELSDYNSNKKVNIKVNKINEKINNDYKNFKEDNDDYSYRVYKLQNYSDTIQLYTGSLLDKTSNITSRITKSSIDTNNVRIIDVNYNKDTDFIINSFKLSGPVDIDKLSDQDLIMLRNQINNYIQKIHNEYYNSIKKQINQNIQYNPIQLYTKLNKKEYDKSLEKLILLTNLLFKKHSLTKTEIDLLYETLRKMNNKIQYLSSINELSKSNKQLINQLLNNIKLINDNNYNIVKNRLLNDEIIDDQTRIVSFIKNDASLLESFKEQFKNINEQSNQEITYISEQQFNTIKEQLEQVILPKENNKLKVGISNKSSGNQNMNFDKTNNLIGIDTSKINTVITPNNRDNIKDMSADEIEKLITTGGAINQKNIKRHLENEKMNNYDLIYNDLIENDFDFRFEEKGYQQIIRSVIFIEHNLTSQSFAYKNLSMLDDIKSFNVEQKRLIDNFNGKYEIVVEKESVDTINNTITVVTYNVNKQTGEKKELSRIIQKVE